VAAALPVEPPLAEATLEPLVDPYEPEPVVPIPGERAVPVVDVAAPERAAEPEGERDARIDEMERALESFGRRRSMDYGRRGRRR
jgi:hypothetical protein